MLGGSSDMAKLPRPFRWPQVGPGLEVLGISL